MSSLSISNSINNLANISRPTYQGPSFIDQVEQVATPLLFTSMTALGAYVASQSSASEGLMVAGLGSSLLCFLGGMTSAIRNKPDAGKRMLGGLLGSSVSIVLLNERATLIQQNHHLADAYNQVSNQLENLEAEKEPFISSQCQIVLDLSQENLNRCKANTDLAMNGLGECSTALSKLVVDSKNHIEEIQTQWKDGCNKAINQTVGNFSAILDTSLKTTDRCNEELKQCYNQSTHILLDYEKRFNASTEQTERALNAGEKCITAFAQTGDKIAKITKEIVKR